MFAQKAQSDSAFDDFFTMSNRLQNSGLIANQQPGLQQFLSTVTREHYQGYVTDNKDDNQNDGPLLVLEN